MELSKIFNCFNKNNKIESLKREVDELRKICNSQNNPIHMETTKITSEHDLKKELTDKLDDNNTDILTKIVFLKEEIQRLDKKVQDLEINLVSSDNYCIIDNKIGGNTSSDESSSDEENSRENNNSSDSLEIIDSVVAI
tara:strand:+ start:338 stop:754 length:417 start_codon:yes stop_codon:yes gene_type:complete